MKRVLTYSLLTTLVLTAGVVIALFVGGDSDAARERLQRMASDALGRELVIDRYDIRWGTEPKLVVQGVSVAAPEWAEAPKLASLDTLELSLSWQGLTASPPRIDALHIKGLRLNLEQRADGSATWEFPELTDDSDEAPENTDRPSLPLLISALTLEDADVVLRLPEASPRRLQLNLEQKVDDEALALSVQGSLNDTPVDIALNVAPLPELVALRATRITTQTQLGEIALDGQLSLKDLLRPQRPQLTLNLTGPSVEYLTDKLGIAPISTGPLDLHAAIQPNGAQMTFNVQGAFGEFTTLLQGAFDDLRTLEQGHVSAAVSGPSAARVATLLGQSDIPDLPFTASTRVAKTGQRLEIDQSRVTVGRMQLDASGVVPDLALPAQADLDLTIYVPALDALGGYRGIPTGIKGSATGKFNVITGADVAKLSGQFISDYGTLNLDGDISRNADLSGTRLNARLRDDQIGDLLRLIEVDAPVVEGPWELQATLGLDAKQLSLSGGQLVLGDDTVKFGLQADREQLAEQLAISIDSAVTDLKKYLALVLDEETLALVPDGALQLALRGQLNNDTFVVESSDLGLAGLQSTITGSVNLKTQASKLNFAFNSDEPAQWVPASRLPKQVNPALLQLPLSVTGNLVTTEGRFALSAEKLALGEHQLSGDIALDPDVEGIYLDLKFSSPDALFFSVPIEGLPTDDRLPITGVIDVDLREHRLDIDRLEINGRDGTVINGKGNLRFGDSFDGSDLALAINVQSLQRVGRLLGMELPDVPLAFDGQILGEPQRMEARNFKLTSGNSVLTGNLSAQNPDHPRYELTLRSELIDLRPFLAEPFQGPDGESPDTEKPKKDAKLIPDTPIDLTPLTTFDAVVDVDIKRVYGHARRLRDVALDAKVEAGQLDITRALLTDEDRGTLVISGFARPEGDSNRIALKALGQDINLGIPAKTAQEVALLPRLSLEAIFFGDGLSPRQLAAGGNGFIQVESGKGQMGKMTAGFLTNDVLDELLTLINPFRKTEPYTNIQCGSLVAAIDKGVLTGDPLLTLVTDKLAIVSEGKVDLRKETLFASFNSVPQKGLGFSATTALNPFVAVGGTLANPQMTMDPQGTIVQGGLAFFTGGLSLVGKGLLDRMTTDETACSNAVTRAKAKREAIEAKYAAFN